MSDHITYDDKLAALHDQLAEAARVTADSKAREEAIEHAIRDALRKEFMDGLYNVGITDLPAKIMVTQDQRRYGPFYLTGVRTSVLANGNSFAVPTLKGVKKDGSISARDPSWREKTYNRITWGQITRADDGKV